MKTDTQASVLLYGGSLTLSSLRIGNAGKISAVLIDGKPAAFAQEGDTVFFETVTVTDKIVVVFASK